jgi:hypothetical protein
MISEGPLEIESERAYVVYDPHLGDIVHLHRVTTFRGGQGLSQQEEEARAIAMAKQFGHAVEGLRVLSVDPRDLNQRVPQRIDLGSLRLVSDQTTEEPTSRSTPTLPSE